LLKYRKEKEGMLTSSNILFDVLDLVEIFVGKPGGILIDTKIRAHTEGRCETFEQDILLLGDEDTPINVDEPSGLQLQLRFRKNIYKS